MREEVLLFVYGSLKSGFEPHQRLLAPYLQRFMPFDVAGQLFHMPDGYPALVLPSKDAPWTGEQRVFGELLVLPRDFDFLGLDAWEVFLPDDTKNSLYLREQRTLLVEGQGREVWIYHMPIGQVQARGGLQIASGTWHG